MVCIQRRREKYRREGERERGREGESETGTAGLTN